MITSTTNTTTSTYNYTQQSTNEKAKSSEFEKTLQNEQMREAQQAKTEEVRFKMIERMSFEYIKDLDKEKIDEIYGDLSTEEKDKIHILRHISTLSENNTLNKVMFDEAKDMLPKEAMSYGFQKMREHSHYKLTGTANISLAVPIVLEKYPEGIPKEIEEKKLSHQEAFDMLLNMIKISKEGIENTEGELQEIHREYYKEYSYLLNKYNNELRQNVTRRI